MSAYKLTAVSPTHPLVISSYYSVDLILLAGFEKITISQLDLSSKKILSIAEYSWNGERKDQNFVEELTAFLQSEDICNKPYRSETIGIEYPIASLVPSGLYSDSSAEDHLSLHYKLPGDHIFLSDDIPGTDIKNVYCLPAGLSQGIRERNANARIFHFATALLSGLSWKERNDPASESVYCQIRNGYLDLVVFRSGQLVFYNSFQFTNREEFVYYILYTLEQLGINAGRQEIILAGEYRKDLGLEDFLAEFTGKISRKLDIPLEASQGHLDRHEMSRYYNLLSLHLCV